MGTYEQLSRHNKHANKYLKQNIIYRTLKLQTTVSINCYSIDLAAYAKNSVIYFEKYSRYYSLESDNNWLIDST